VDRVDVYPTHTYKGFALRAGRAYPFGATLVPGGINFSVFSSHATSCSLVLFTKGERWPIVEIPFFNEFRIGNVYAMTVFGVQYENIEYGLRMDGPHNPVMGHRFDAGAILADPYAKLIGGRAVWGEAPDWTDPYQHRAAIALDDFDWEHDRPLEIPIEDLIIYEMHVRGFTRHPTSGVRAPGTFDALREKIPYLKALGVNCLELLPIFEFDEFENNRVHPETGERLLNYWGYSPVGFFAPKAGYASTGRFGMQVDELKYLVKEIHANGMEVILDVVFNHTAEGDARGPTISFKGIDNSVYYMLAQDGSYLNFSGTGNTLNCNHPVVRSVVLDALRYWVAEFHIDGFRFDLASILGRDRNGVPLANPPLLEHLALDPILAKCKLIAEAWDAAGLYQVGSFPAYDRWAEWNGRYRDAVRRFIKSDAGLTREVALRLQGSPDLYGSRAAGASINFVTCHDGFTLADLVSYAYKHNEANGEGNGDGTDENLSWNCGSEGPTTDPAINDLRRRQIKNAIAILMVSRGVPMMLMGDECGRTQDGNNNAYCHDNEISWFDWALTDSNAELLTFAQRCLHLRRSQPMLRRPTSGTVADGPRHRDLEVSWHGTQAWSPDWSDSSRTLAFMVQRNGIEDMGEGDDCVYVALNMYWEPLWFELPQMAGVRWHVALDTSLGPPDDAAVPGSEPALMDQSKVLREARSVVVLIGRRPA
jgi:isoamylase